jgi:hypothetical protein
MEARPTAAPDPAVSPGKTLDFLDFGCGSGKSMTFVRKLVGGEGLGVDISEQAVAECWQAGFRAEWGDLLTYTGRNVATAVTAVDVLPEIGERAEFEQAVSRLVLAARNYVLIQHSYFDADSTLALQGRYAPSHFGKRIRFKPSMADYLTLLSRLAASHAVSGVAMFGVGEASIASLVMDPAAPDLTESPSTPGAYRSLRVIIGRKEVPRFRAGLRRARTGEMLFLWERKADPV